MLIDNPKRDHPERRTATVARELVKHNIDIAALSKTQLAGEGQLREVNRGYTFFWKGKPDHNPRIHRVSFTIRNKITDVLLELPSGVNERLMTLRLHLSRNQYATVISTYAPTLDSDEEVKQRFYSGLNNTLASIPRDDKGHSPGQLQCPDCRWTDKKHLLEDIWDLGLEVFLQLLEDDVFTGTKRENSSVVQDC
ncbi:hypothetical protein Y1Q_0017899 [Alligator mississippiensis]|uniref:Uncharacterized protein n=1 Tax=Alligator mississippiensis TaxID=8496 RepID=A0A151MXK8_ALLMI|nr:hypothetical protein Y1Q_0017899 [Alligator mississippiensis]